MFPSWQERGNDPRDGGKEQLMALSGRTRFLGEGGIRREEVL